jgi:hypothetical protein
MSNKDEFDDPEGFESAFGKIASAMEQGREGIRQRGPLIGVLTAGVALFVLFAVFWSTYPRGDRAGEGADGPLPIVRADASPFRTAPDDPGGMQIPHRDSTIFETIRSADATQGSGRVESLLPPPEEPIDRTQMFAGLKTETLESDDANDLEAGVGPGAVIAAQPELEPAADGEILSTDAVADQAVASVNAARDAVAKPAPKPVRDDPPASDAIVKTEPAAGDAKAKTDASPGTHFIQLGSVKDRAGAEAEWKKLQRDFPAQLGNLTLRIQEANLGEKGTFYRIQGGALSQENARAICAAITSKKPGGCMVVAR